jgi:hypothetical protein
VSLLSTASFGQIQLLPAPIGTSSDRGTSTVNGKTNSSVTYTYDSQAQIDATATFMGTVANIGQLVVNAQIPCGSIVSLIGETQGPLAFTCGPMAPALQIPVSLRIAIRATFLLLQSKSCSK